MLSRFLRNKKVLFSSLVAFLLVATITGVFIFPRPGSQVVPSLLTSTPVSTDDDPNTWDGRIPTQVKKWSDPATWGGQVPVAGADITILVEQVIELDVSPPPLASLLIMGTLIVAEKDLELRANWIMLHDHGKFLAGSVEEPFQHQLIITLTGENRDEDIMGSGSKFLGVMGGTLELHGQPRTSWLRLGETAPAGTTQIVLEQPVDWRTGDRIVISSTDYEPAQAEEVIIKAIDGAKVTLDRPLQYMHWGEIQTFADQQLDERAEVGLLSHNIVIRGDELSQETGFGGQTIVMGQRSFAFIEHVEFYHMGQQGLLARYPMHWHTIGNANGSYIKNSAISHSFNRCVTIHGTHNLLVQGNVAYNTIGHCYFLEDGIETGNVLEKNLGIMTRTPPEGTAVLQTDLRPATFWITNPDNILRGNVAAGSEGIGFWYAMPENPTGMSRTAKTDATIWPRYTPLGEFSDNVAHSNEDLGLHVDDGATPDGSSAGYNYIPRENPAQDSAPVPAEFKNFTAYKHRFIAVWMRGFHLSLVGAKMADNVEAIIFAARETFVMNSLIIGETDNKGNPGEGEQMGLDGRSLPRPGEPGTPLSGFSFYDGRVGAEGVTFVNFQSNSQRPAGALGYLRDNGNPIDVRNFAQGLTFVNANQVYLEDPDARRDGDKASLFVDTDGSVTGTAGQYIVANFPLLVNDACSFKQSWNTYICANRYINFSIASQGGSVAPVEVTRNDGPQGTFAGMGDTYVSASILVNHTYTFAFQDEAPYSYQLDFENMQAGEWMKLVLPHPGGNFTVYRDAERSRQIAAAQSMNAFDQSSGDTYYYDQASGLLYLKAIPMGENDWARINVEMG